MENREIEKQITEILYNNSNDDSDHLRIKFEKINDVIKLLVNVSDQQNKQQLECTEHIKEVCDDYEKQNKQLLDEIEELKSKLILSEKKVKLNYNCIIDLQSELKDKERVNEQKDKEIKKLEFMIENGLNYSDLQNDIDKFPQ